MKIYADHAATTAMSEAAIEAMTRCMREEYGNPSSLYRIGQRAKEVLEEARAEVAAVLNAQPQEVYFTSGGSEADNQAIRSAALAGKKKGKNHIISTAFEHHAVLHTLEQLKAEGFEVTLLDVHENGVVRPEEVESAIRPETCLVTVMYANNEIGTVQPILEIGAGTGCYSVTLAKEGYRVTAVELVAHNLDILKSKLDGTERITPILGNALDLSFLSDGAFDLTMLLGPMYHLYTKEDKHQALREAVRVTKPGGRILVAYRMNEATVIQYVFGMNKLREVTDGNLLTPEWHC